ncbi:MAG: VWA domain-containing protein [Anaerolineae bacterium]|nr:VWA domain-containing protein [Anaerolineae bacterium]
MSKLWPVLVAVGVVLGLLAPTARADGMILPGDLGAIDYPAVRYHHVTVEIEDGHAVTRVEQAFYNPYDVAVNGRYLFPLPPEAMLGRFEAVVDGKRQAVERQDAAVTRDALLGAVVRQQDPSLLQYAGWESLALDLSLAPGESREMVLEYDEVLAPAGGLYHYRYVLSTERYSARPVEEVSIAVDVRASGGLATIYSPGHDVEVERVDAGRARVTWQVSEANPDTDFELYYAAAEGGFGAGLLTGTSYGAAGGDDDHFLLLFSPEVAPAHTDGLPKDLVFVIDRSGSMSGEKIEQAQAALQFILGQLGADDRFSIVSFDHEIAAFSDTLKGVDDGTLRAARDYVDDLSARGNTDLEGALQAGLRVLGRTEGGSATRLVVFLTDGLPTEGITDEEAIARLVGEANARVEARLHVFGVGYDVNTHLLDGLAAGNGGSVTYVRPGESVEAALTEFYAQIAHPILTDVEIEFEGLDVADVYPEQLPDLFAGSSLMVAGRYEAEGEEVAVRVRGRAGTEVHEYVYHFHLDEGGAGRDFVPRLWATRRAGALMDRVRVEGETEALAAEIRELGLAYGIVTPYTTFAIEGQAAGAASAQNMALYGSAELNLASGRVAVEARVQNQAYQGATQADLAAGANVLSYEGRNVARLGGQQVDLALLQGREIDGALTEEWIEGNVAVDRTVEFGSDEYLRLASDPAARPFLQSGTNVVFAYGGEVIVVRGPVGADVDLVGEAPPNDGPGGIDGRQGNGGVDGTAPRAGIGVPLALVAAAAGVGLLLIGGLGVVVGVAIVAHVQDR